MSGGIYAVLQHKAILSYLLVLRTCVSPIRLLSRTFVLHDRSTGFDQVCFFCRAFSWALLRANSCARQLRGFCFPGSSPTNLLEAHRSLGALLAKVSAFSTWRRTAYSLFLPLRNCRVLARKSSRHRSPLASFAPRQSVSLKRATRSDLHAPISSLWSPVSRPCSLAVR